MEHLLCDPTVGGECNVCGMDLVNNLQTVVILRYVI